MTWYAPLAALLSIALLTAPTPASADPVKCQKTLSKQLQKLAKKQVQQVNKCLDKENIGKVPGPCPDATANLKISKIATVVGEKISADCSMADLAILGFAGNCELDAGVAGVEAGCFALPVTTPAEFSTCLQCWQGAEISEMIATLYGSHADEVCGGDLTSTSAVCSPLDYTTPMPDQRNLTNAGEADCQKAIGKGGFKYLILREKTLANCALQGNSQADCLLDAKIQIKLDKASGKLSKLVDKKCGNRAPVASPPFCCKAGGGNMCVAATTRDECLNTHFGQVQEGKICDVDNTCGNPPGNVKGITWWENCPEGGAALADLDDIKGCVETSVDRIIDELQCWTFPNGGGGNWPCPASPSGAFVDGVVSF